MKISVSIIGLLILFSCDNKVETQRGRVTYSFEKTFSQGRAATISDLVSQRIKFLNFEELNLIESIHVDSIPFAYILTIKYPTSVTTKIRERFKGLGAILSDFDLSGTPVHLVLKDNSGALIENLQFDKEGAKTVSNYEKSKSISFEVYEDVPKFQTGGLDLILRNGLAELFVTGDTVVVKVQTENDEIKVDISVDLENLKMETLKQQVQKIDPIYVYAVFGYRAVYFQLRDKRTKELTTVFKFRKL